MTTDNRDIEKEALNAGHQMRTAGVSDNPETNKTRYPEPTAREKEQIAENRESERIAMEIGNLMPIERKHILNYNILTKLPDNNGQIYSDVSIALYVGDKNKAITSGVARTGDDKAVIIVNRSALKITPEFTRDYLNHQLKFEHFIELTPEYMGNYNEAIEFAEKSGYTKPPRVILSGGENEDKAVMQIIKSPDGTPLLLINSTAHEWTEPFAEKYVMPTDKKISDGIARGKYIDVSSLLAPQTFEYIKEAATNNNIRDIKILRRTDKELYSSAAAESTAEGTAVIFTEHPFFYFSEETKTAILAHEIQHVALGHTSAKGLVEYHNNKRAGKYESLRNFERAADISAACDSVLPPGETAHYAAGFFSYSAITDGNFFSKTDTHPPDKERAEYLHFIANNPDACDILMPKIPRIKSDKSTNSNLQH